MITILVLIFNYSQTMCVQTEKPECELWAQQCLVDHVFGENLNIEFAYEQCAESLPTEYYK